MAIPEHIRGPLFSPLNQRDATELEKEKRRPIKVTSQFTTMSGSLKFEWICEPKVSALTNHSFYER